MDNTQTPEDVAEDVFTKLQNLEEELKKSVKLMKQDEKKMDPIGQSNKLSHLRGKKEACEYVLEKIAEMWQ